MAEAVVDVLEAVEIEEQHGAMAVLDLGFVEGQLQAVLEQHAVGQAGQRVMVGLVVEARLGVLEAADVGEYRDMVGDPVLAVAHCADGHPGRVGLAVLASAPQFALPVIVALQAGADLRVELGVGASGGEQL